jgi:hypothetical protein
LPGLVASIQGDLAVSWLKQLLPQLRWGAGPKGIPFHTYFLDRVIRVPAVQRWRNSVTESWEEVGPFFDDGRIPGDANVASFAWSIGDEPPEPFPNGVVIADYRKPPMSKPMQRAWSEALKRFGKILVDLAEGRRTAVGTHAVTGARRELAAAEWPFGGRHMIGVRSGDIFERSDKAGVPANPRWRSIEILLPELPLPPPKRGQIDREDFWLCLTILRERGELLPRGPYSTKWAKKWIKERYGVGEHDERELRRYLHDARDGATTRPKSTNRKRGA